MKRISVGIRTDQEMLKEILINQINGERDMQAFDMDDLSSSSRPPNPDVYITSAALHGVEAPTIELRVDRPHISVVAFDPKGHKMSTFSLRIERNQYVEPSVDTVIKAIRDCIGTKD